MKRVALLVLALSPLLAARASADDDARARAREHFDRAMHHLSQRELRDAQRELSTAHRVHPHFAVLYNIGKLHAELGEPLAAVRALRQYLTKAGAQVDAARRQEVDRLIAEQLPKLARVTLRIEPAGASISVDEKSVGQSPLSEPLLLEPGRRALRVSRAGHEPDERQLDAVAGSDQTIRITLRQLVPPPALARLAVRCNVLDVTILVDGREHARTPIESIVAPSGTRELVFERAGYRSTKRRVVFARDGSGEVSCDLRALTPVPAANGGRIELELASPHTLLVDGSPISPGRRVPEGRHRVEVRALGFRPWTKTVEVDSGKTLRLSPELEPNADTLRARQSQRTLAYALGGHGIGLLAAAGVLYVYNTTRHQEWEDEQKDLDSKWNNPQLGDARALDDLQADQIRNDEQLESIRRFDRLTVGIAAVGGALVIAGVAVYLTGDDPAPRSQPTLALGRNGSNIGWSHVW